MKLTHALFFISGFSAGALAPEFLVPAKTAAPLAKPAVEESVEKMLAEWVEDYRWDATARALTFGIDVRDAEPSRWHVVVGELDSSGEERSAELVPGFPKEPAPYFTTDESTLRQLFSGELASLTAMGKAFSTDFAPLDIDFTPGFEPDEATMDHLTRLAFHFWTRGFPELIRFGQAHQTRPLHGGQGTLFYYQKGFRSGYFQIRPGDHINAEVDSRTNPFPSLLVLTKGQAEARIGEVECQLYAGEAVYVGPGVSHELWVDEGASTGAEGILVMFGDGA